MGEAHDDARVGPAERADERRHRVDGERRQGDEVEVPGDDAGDGVDVGADRVDRPQRLAGRRHERLAGGRQRDAAAEAVEQRDAELALERRDGLRQRRLGDEARRRGGGERARASTTARA